VLPAASLDAALRVCITSPRRSRAALALAQSPRHSQQPQEGGALHGCQHSQALRVKKHFVALCLGIVSMVEDEGEGGGEKPARTVLLADPSVQEAQGALLASRVLLVQDLQGEVCLLDSDCGGGGGLPAEEFFRVCGVCSRTAQEQLVPLLRPLLQ
jgi:hypothetical protein